MRRYIPWLFLVAGLVALASLVGWMFGVWSDWPSIAIQLAKGKAWAADDIDRISNLGIVGDSYGALNAGMAGLAFAGVLVTLFIQMLATQDQHAQKHRESFESRFFQLLSLGRSLREEVQFEHGRTYLEHHPDSIDKPCRGFAAFEAMHRDLSWHLDEVRPTADSMADRDRLGSIYRTVVHDHSEATVSPYFRILYTILRRIDEDDLLSREDKHAYANLVRSQITSAELSVASLNGLFRESANFSYFLEKFRMFKYMPDSNVKLNIRPQYWFATFLGRDECAIEEPPASTVVKELDRQPWLR